MKVRRISLSALPVAAGAFIFIVAAPAFAGNAEVGSLQDGRVHGFQGCLTQESTGTRYFDLTNAKSDDGKSVGTVRLTGSLFGIQPKESLNQERT